MLLLDLLGGLNLNLNLHLNQGKGGSVTWLTGGRMMMDGATFLIDQHNLASVIRSRRPDVGRIVVLTAGEIMAGNVEHLLIRDQEKMEADEGQDRT